MALISMTGFGRAEATMGRIKVEAEIGSVNRKQFDVHVNLPKPLMALESRIEKLVHQAISRGAIHGSVRTRAAAGARPGDLLVDGRLAGAYVRGLRKTAAQLGLKDDLSARSLTALPDVIQYRSAEEDVEAIWPAVERAMRKAVSALLRMKRAEGRSLEADIGRRLTRLAGFARQIRRRSPLVTQKYAKALRARLKTAGVGVRAGDPQILREIALFADRADISEETVRLESHLRQAGRLLRARKRAGRPLDFLCQEMGREINTVGSKANDLAISKLAIACKSELESIREQVQNVE
ncbi:MAG: YicC/YloC family endoribonuclease [Verrucomicrobiota bacterium]|nr:YicC/YloC family endoribonuclease [Verrucomicrobiota bacterium]